MRRFLSTILLLLYLTPILSPPNIRRKAGWSKRWALVTPPTSFAGLGHLLVRLPPIPFDSSPPTALAPSVASPQRRPPLSAAYDGYGVLVCTKYEVPKSVPASRRTPTARAAGDWPRIAPTESEPCWSPLRGNQLRLASRTTAVQAGLGNISYPCSKDTVMRGETDKIPKATGRNATLQWATIHSAVDKKASRP